MDQPSQHIPAMHLLRPWCWQWLSDRLVGRSQTKASMRSLAVVMLDVRSRCLWPRTSIQSRHSVLTVRTQRSAKALAWGARMGVRITSASSL